ncbi:MAG: 3'-5' exonuclease [Phreatobacter sp.]
MRGAGRDAAKGGPMSIVAIDFETANESRASPCAIGLAWIEAGRVTRREYRLIRPGEMRFSPWNIRIHGIRPQDVAASGEFPDVISEFLPDIEGGTVLAHNAAFDVSVLRQTLAAYGMRLPGFTAICTLAVARRAWPGAPGFDLASIARHLGIRFRHHDAGEDAFACAEVALAATRLADVGDIGQLSRRDILPQAAGAASDAAPRRPLRHQGAPTQGGGERLRFAVRGSAGHHYEVVGEIRGGALVTSCTCAAGRNRLRCKHILGLFDGCIDALVSDNVADVEKLHRWRLAFGPAAPARPFR